MNSSFYYFVLFFNFVYGSRLVCYFDAGTARNARLRDGFTPLAIENIDSKLCTHLIYASVLSIDAKNTDAINPNIRQFAALKEKNSDLKIMVHIDEIGATEMADLKDADKFAQTVVSYLKNYKLDGVDISWKSAKSNAQREGFNRLLNALKKAFSSNNYILSVHVSAEKTIIDDYNFVVLNNMADFINVATYDLNMDKDVADYPSPLFPPSVEDIENNVQKSIAYWLEQLPPAKINMGIPFHGISWLLSGDEESLSPPIKEVSNPTPMNYYDICMNVNSKGWQMEHDPDHITGCYAHSPFSAQTGSVTWVGFDDINMVKNKTAYARSRALGGVMIWDLSQDDFANSCGDGVNPLLNAVAEELRRQAPPVSVGSEASTLLLSSALIFITFLLICSSSLNY